MSKIALVSSPDTIQLTCIPFCAFLLWSVIPPAIHSSKKFQSYVVLSNRQNEYMLGYPASIEKNEKKNVWELYLIFLKKTFRHLIYILESLV